MMTNLAIDYFSKLLNCAVDEQTGIRLSSGQRARAHTWLRNNNFNVNGAFLRGEFSIRQLVGGVGNKVPDQYHEKLRNLEATDSTGDVKESVGIDIQHMLELFPQGIPSDPKSDAELLGIYTIKELSYAQSKEHPVQTLAGLFAAKEAIQKCSEDKLHLTDIEILPDANGKPNVRGYSISISHSHEYAVAIAMKVHKAEIVAPFTPSGNANSNESQSLQKRKFRDLIIPSIVVLLAILEMMRFLNIAPK